ncbi:hypothetical protein ARMGADRAFT_1090906 [Armillaria gallica]|uniref:Uncharacterized protein n=1 Tax=Armillaria gallica TaxID=47427 RepID=A0A2H3CFJ4_ARMGA|nr:hypothetical protein ARMGADRAFT_1090906 [Armillaria gallica]
MSIANWCTTHHPTVKETEIMPYLAPGFSDNQQLDDLYYQNYDQYNKLMPSQFIEIVQTRIYRTWWHLDVRRGVEVYRQGDGPFIELFEKMSGQNQLLEGNQEFLKDAQLIPLIKSCMNADLHDRFAEPDMEVAKLYNLIVNGKVDLANDETLAHWARLVELEDEKLRREREKPPVQSFAPFSQIPPMPQSFPAFANTFYGPNVAAMSQNQNQNQVHPFQAFGGNQGQLAPCYSDLEKWAMFFLAYFCIQCHLPFQNHQKMDNAHPNGFENHRVPDPTVTPRRPYMITAERVANAVARQQAKGDIVPQYFLNIAQSAKPGSQFSAASSSNAIPLGPSFHSQNVAPATLVLLPEMISAHAALMPPFSNCAIVGIDDEDDGYIDADSRGYDDEPLSPPPHNVCPHCSLNVDQEDFERSGIHDVPDHGRHADTEPLPHVSDPSTLRDRSGSKDVAWKSRRSPVHQHSAPIEIEDCVDYDITFEDPGLTLGLEPRTVVSEVSDGVLSNVFSVPTPMGDPPLSEPHLLWHCTMSYFSPSSKNPHLPVTAMMDISSPFVLIRPEAVTRANLHVCKLPEPIIIDTATPSENSRSALTKFVHVQLHDTNNLFSAHKTHAIITPGLCTDIILGLLFLSHNNITISSSC